MGTTEGRGPKIRVGLLKPSCYCSGGKEGAIRQGVFVADRVLSNVKTVGPFLWVSYLKDPTSSGT